MTSVLPTDIFNRPNLANFNCKIIGIYCFSISGGDCLLGTQKFCATADKAAGFGWEILHMLLSHHLVGLQVHLRLCGRGHHQQEEGDSKQRSGAHFSCLSPPTTTRRLRQEDLNFFFHVREKKTKRIFSRK